MTRIFLSPPQEAPNERPYLHAVLDSGYPAPGGPEVRRFESALARTTGSPYVACFNTGTAALHLALRVLGIGPGDEVLCSSWTFVAGANVIRYLGATPVFLDSEPRTWNLDPKLLEQALTERKPKALLLTHLYGRPADMDAILPLLAKHNVPLVEDAAEALGATYEGKALGTFGTVGVLSFNGNKIISASGGGALLSADETLVQKARFLGAQAKEDAPHYEHTELGYNYQMSSLLAAVGRAQLQTLEERLEKRKAVNTTYRALLNEHPTLAFPDPLSGENHWLTTLLLPTQALREKVRFELSEAEIESRPLWKPMHLQPLYRDAPKYITGASGQLFERGLCLPSGPELTGDQVEEIAGVIRGALD